MERHKTGAAKGAAQLRTALKELWPNITFRIRSETYSGGDSINICWNFGPTSKEVDAIANQWQDGYFDGMQDMYIHGSSRSYTLKDGTTIPIEDVKYIFT